MFVVSTFFARRIFAAGLLLMLAAVAHAQNHRIDAFAGGGIGDGGQALSAYMQSIDGMNTNNSDLFLADSVAHRVRRVKYPGTMSTVAGSGVPGFSGDNGPPAAARFNAPTAVATTDAYGAIYIADAGNARIRQVSSDRITTFVGNGALAHSGDGGPPHEAGIGRVSDMAVDDQYLYFVTPDHHRVRRIDRLGRGAVITIAGTGEPGYTGDGGPATAARLDRPTRLEIDNTGNWLYVLDAGNGAVRRIRLVDNGRIEAVVGRPDGVVGKAVDAREARLEDPADFAMDSYGTRVQFIAERGIPRVREIGEDGKLRVIAGNGGRGTPIPGPALASPLGDPSGIVATTTGPHVSLLDGTVWQLVKDAQGKWQLRLAVSRSPGNGPAATARVAAPSALVVEDSGRIVFHSGYRLRVRGNALDPSAGVGSLVGNGDVADPATWVEGGNGQDSAIGASSALAHDASGRLVFTDPAANALRVKDGVALWTLAGNGSAVTSGDGGQATAAGLPAPDGVARGPDQALYVASDHRIRRIAADGSISTFAGADAGFDGDGGAPAAARFRDPGLLVFDSEGALYVLDRGNHRVRRIRDGVVTTIAGNGDAILAGLGGPATAASFASLAGLAVDDDGVVYVSDRDSHRVLRIDADGILRTHAGNGTPGDRGDGARALSASLRAPTALAIVATGLVVADTGNDRLRLVERIDDEATEGPGAPPAPVATAGVGDAWVEFEPPAEQGSGIVGYRLRSLPAGGVDGDLDGNSRIRHVTGLTNGVEYRFTVQALGPLTDGPESPPSAPVTPSLAEARWLTVEDLQVGEADRSAIVVARLDRPARTAVGFRVLSHAGSASINGTSMIGTYDARLYSTYFEIPVGETSVDVPLQIVDDTDYEGDETLSLEIVDLGGALAADPTVSLTILDNDVRSLLAHDDRFAVLDLQAAELDVSGNDFKGLNEGVPKLSIVRAPAQGTATVVRYGAADSRVSFQAAASAVGEDTYRYRACLRGECSEAEVTVVIRPSLMMALGPEGWTGFSDLPFGGLRALPSARFVVSRFVTAITQPFSVARQIPDELDSLWQAAPSSRAVQRWSIAPATIDREWDIVADISEVIGPGIREPMLVLGIDSNGDGAASPGEVRCTTLRGLNQTSPTEPCELRVLQPAGTTLRYWTMTHNTHVMEDLDGMVRVYQIPVGADDTEVSVTGPGHVETGTDFEVRLVHRPSLRWREHRMGYLEVYAQPGMAIGRVPLRIATANMTYPEPIALASGRTVRVEVGGGNSLPLAYLDVPPGVDRVTLSVSSPANVDLEVLLQQSWDTRNTTQPFIESDAFPLARSAGPGGNETIVLEGDLLYEARHYLKIGLVAGEVPPTPVPLDITATIVGAADPVPASSYFNPQRPGSGLFLYPAGGDLAGLWYTYFQDGTPTWYWLQGKKPGPSGVWSGDIYRAAWDGDSNFLVRVGRASVVPGTGDVPAFRYSYELDGQVGSEPMLLVGHGCPTLAGLDVDISTHWYNPARAGTGYSVQTWPDYEFFAAFVYDGVGVPRYLGAERSGFGGSASDFVLYQTRGACPRCDYRSTEYADIGVFGRTIHGDGTMTLQLDGIFAGGVPGAWTADERVQMLGGPGTTQGCDEPEGATTAGKATATGDRRDAATSLRGVIGR